MNIESLESKIFDILMDIKALTAKMEGYEIKLKEMKKDVSIQKATEVKVQAVPDLKLPVTSATDQQKMTFAATANMPGLPTTNIVMPTQPQLMQSMLPSMQSQATQTSASTSASTSVSASASASMPSHQSSGFMQQPSIGFMHQQGMPQQQNQQGMPQQHQQGMPQAFQPPGQFQSGLPYGGQPNYGIPTISNQK